MQENITEKTEMQLDLHSKNTFDISELVNKGYYKNPYPFYDRLRQHYPVNLQENGVWVLSRYDDIKFVLKDKKFKREGLEKLFGVRHSSVKNTKQNPPSMLRQDPPEHSRLRGAVNKCFTPVALSKLHKFINKMTNQILDTVKQGEIFDFVKEIAYPLPIAVICEIMNVPAEDQKEVYKYVRQVTKSFDVLDNLEKEKLVQEGLEGREALCEYFRHLIEKRKDNLADDLVSTLLLANAEEQISIEEIITMCVLIFISGHETTASLIGSGLYALTQFPDQWELLQQHPKFIPSAIEEFLRYESPVQRLVCLAAEDIVMNGQYIKENSLIISLLGAANRDPAQYTNPNNLDVTRKQVSHLAFGDGIHICLGIYLARMEAKIVFETVFSRYKNVSLSKLGAIWNKTVTFRGLESLPVYFFSKTEC